MSTTCPSGWKEYRLGELAHIDRQIVEPDRIRPGTNYVGLEHITSDGTFVDRKPVDNGELASSKFVFGPEHLLYGKLRPYLRKIALPDFSGVCSTDILPIKPVGNRADRAYLFHYLRQQRMVDLAEARSTGVNLPRLSPKVLEDFEVFAPVDVAEQRRIAAILDNADAIRRKRRQALAEIDALLRAAFLDMFGDPATNPHGFTLEPVRKFGRVMTGNTPPRANPQNFGSQIEWIKSDNISDAKYFLTKAAEGLSKIGRSVGRVAPAGSILVTCIAGSPKSIGTAALADREVAFNQQINAIIPFQPQLLGFLFVQIVLAKRLIQRKSSNAMKGMVTKTEFEEVCIMKPPAEQQRRFSEWFTRFVGAFRKLQAAAEASEEAFGSLSQRAFRGGL